jgi:hypothetical protein
LRFSLIKWRFKEFLTYKLCFYHFGVFCLLKGGFAIIRAVYPGFVCERPANQENVR